jgi:hypothetical protein
MTTREIDVIQSVRAIEYHVIGIRLDSLEHSICALSLTVTDTSLLYLSVSCREFEVASN